jgi:hypothetical protein
MKTKQELKNLYAKSKHASNNFAETLQAHLSETLGFLGYQLTCISECVNFGTKRNPRQFTFTTVIIQRGCERFMTRRINALIDYSFSPEITESGLFDIIYNRV